MPTAVQAAAMASAACALLVAMAYAAFAAGRRRAAAVPEAEPIVGEIVPPEPPPERPKQALLLRVGGRVIDPGAWPADVIETVKKEYFLPPAAPRTYLARVDLTGTCPKRHATVERVGVMASTAATAQSIVQGMPRARSQIVCGECGKTATVTGRSIAWEGPFSQWDGAT